MGAMQNQKGNRKKSRRSRRNKPQELVGWLDINQEVLLELIRTMDGQAIAIRLGRTRDGASFSVGIYDGDDYFTEYHAGLAGADEWLMGFIEDYTN